MDFHNPPIVPGTLLGPPAHERNWDIAMDYLFKAKRVEHPKVNAVMERMAKQLNIATPRLFMTESFHPMFGGTMANAGAVPVKHPHLGGTVVATRRMFDMLHYSPHAEVPKTFQAVLGHEMAHYQHWERIETWRPTDKRFIGDGHIAVGAATTVAALILLDRVLAGQHHGQGALDDVTAKARKEIDDARGPVPKGVEEHVAAVREHENMWLRGAQLVAAGALGIGAMKASVKHLTPRMMRSFEFEADRVAAELLGDHKPVIELLQKLEQDSYRVSREEPEQFRNLTKKHAEFVKRNHAHPSTEERIAALEELGKTRFNKGAGVVR